MREGKKVLGVSLAPSRTAHWLVVEKASAQMQLNQVLRVKGRESATPAGDGAASEPWPVVPSLGRAKLHGS